MFGTVAALSKSHPIWENYKCSFSEIETGPRTYGRGAVTRWTSWEEVAAGMGI